ncbi:MAG: histidine kinase [Prolixibacteraceae bacterium]
MLLQVALILAIILQLFAALLSIKLVTVTKYNVSWVLISTGFILLAIRRFIEFIPFVSDASTNRQVFNWLGVIASVFFAVGLFLIQKIFRYMKRMEQEKTELEKELLHAIIQAEERERKRFAKDLHDGLGPILSSVKMSLSTIGRRDYDETSRSILRNTESAIDEAIKSTREISSNLSPHILENFGLNKAIRNFIHKINLTAEMQIDFTTNINEERFENDLEVVIYRVICELIHNTIKHARASNAEVTLFSAGKYLHCTYHDNGIGFNQTQHSKIHQTGTGITNIFSRITSLNGTFEHNSQVGKGIAASFSIPFN